MSFVNPLSSIYDLTLRSCCSLSSSKPTELSEFTIHRRCLEARHALLGESLALVEELSALRDVRPFPCHLPNWGQQTVYLLRFER